MTDFAWQQSQDISHLTMVGTGRALCHVALPTTPNHSPDVPHCGECTRLGARLSAVLHTTKETPMDPNATLDRIADLLDRAQRQHGGATAGVELDIACQDLFDWLTAGGFAPDWTRHPVASSYYDCRAVSHRRGARV